MSIAPWLLPVLWREHDWRGALERLRTELAAVDATPEKVKRAAVDLARATEYIEPDRRKAIAILERAGNDNPRARELALELGWWSAYARLTLCGSTSELDPNGIVDEAEAWWDAGQPDLCALALSGLSADERSEAAIELSALVAGRDLASHAARALARARASTGAAAADGYVMAARFARVAGKPNEVTERLEAALGAAPSHAKAASLLLGLARQSRDPEAIRRYLNLRLAGADPTNEVDRMRACACALIDSEHHRGFGLRLLRQALGRAYEAKLPEVPGHLAMWTLLAAHASADGTRRELLPFVIEALQGSPSPCDRVWLGALATEITLRDAQHPVIAGAYVEIVAEHAPDHPIVRELVATIAATESAASAEVPAAAIAAATAQIDDGIDIDLDETYADATEASLGDDDLEEVVEEPVRPASGHRISSSIQPIIVDRVPETPAYLPGVSAPSKRPSSTMPPMTKPASTGPLRSIAPLSVATPTAPAKSEAIVPPSIANPSSLVEKPKLAIVPRITGVPAIAPRPKDPAPVLDALRTPGRPVVPPKPPDPIDAAPRARRISIPIDVRIVLPNGKRVAGHSRDISTSGLFLLVAAELVVGDDYAIELMLPGAEPFTEDEYRARARIARKDEGGYGIELVTPDAKLLAALAAL